MENTVLYILCAIAIISGILAIKYWRDVRQQNRIREELGLEFTWYVPAFQPFLYSVGTFCGSMVGIGVEQVVYEIKERYYFY